MHYAVQVVNIFKKYNESVLEDVSFNIKKGSFTALLGRNGSGKSTVLNILMGLELLDKGDCLISGKSIKDDPYSLKNKMGLVTEKVNFDYPVSVEKFIKKYSKLFPQYDSDIFFSITKDLALQTNKQFSAYSRGQKMQLVLASALAQKPELLLIDEVTSVLDAFSKTYFIEKLKHLASNGGTVVLTTNIVSEVQYHCTDVIFLSQKKLKLQSGIKDIPYTFKKVLSSVRSESVQGREDILYSGTNSDGTYSYIVPSSFDMNFENNLFSEDRRRVSLEDIYVYYSQKDQ